jgi:hypothetical protein
VSRAAARPLARLAAALGLWLCAAPGAAEDLAGAPAALEAPASRVDGPSVTVLGSVERRVSVGSVRVVPGGGRVCSSIAAIGGCPEDESLAPTRSAAPIRAAVPALLSRAHANVPN